MVKLNDNVLKAVQDILRKGSDVKPNEVLKAMNVSEASLQHPLSKAFVPYPDHGDPHFNEKIAAKKEFKKHMYEATNMPTCDARAFSLTPNQRFLRHFMNPYTQYNSILLFHGVGVGKSCSAISIAEQFHDVYNKPALVLLPTNLKDNFMEQVFDLSKHERGQQQCTGSVYIDNVPNRHILSRDTLLNKINKRIRENYQLMGFGEFANVVKDVEETVTRIETRSHIARAKIDAKLKRMFSDRVIIIDEVHNARAEKEATTKKVPPLLLRVLTVAENVKLVVLTATPMFNNSKEIVMLLNYIMANEKRPLLEPKNLFDKEGLLTKEGEAKLIEVTRGYVSYMRGENPFTFPARLYPTMHTVVKQYVPPLHDIKGHDIPEEHVLHKITLFPSQMKKAQKAVYLASVQSSNTSLDNDINDEDDLDEDLDDKNQIMQQAVQISNMVYPSPKRTLKTAMPIEQHYGEKGWDNCFINKAADGKFLKVEYAAAFADYNFLSLDHLADCSAKLNAIVKEILKSEGVVYVFSYYLYSALLPLAIALEHCGFRKYSPDGEDRNILRNPAQRPTEFRGYYSVLSRETKVCPNFKKEVEAIRRPQNSDGSVVRVILGTSVSSEGIDFKCIRQIHFVEPWYHMNRIEQIIGRGNRHCSHMDLPPEKRNVTIYHHVNTLSKSAERNETIDERIYRIAETKQTNIDAVENILRRNAVDCMLNRYALYYPKSKTAVPMTTSDGQKIMYHLGDDVGSKYDEGAKCIGWTAQAQVQEDDTTFNASRFDDIVPLYQQKLSAVIGNDPFTLEDILQQLDKSVDKEMVFVTLDRLVTHRIPFENKDGLRGTLDYVHDRYLFLFEDAYDKRITLQARASPAQKVSRAIRVPASTRAKVVHLSFPWDMLNQQVEEVFDLAGLDVKRHAHLHPFAIGYVIDRLNEENLMTLATQVVQDHMNQGREYPKEVLQSLRDGHIVMEHDDLWFIRNPFKEEVYVQVNSDSTTSASVLDVRHLEGMQPHVPDEGLRGWVGYVVPNLKKDKRDFKVINQAANSDGFVCKQTRIFTVEVIKTSIDEVDSRILKHIDERKHKKENMCVVYELLLRNKKGAFGRLYPAIYALRLQKIKAADEKEKKKRVKK